MNEPPPPKNTLVIISGSTTRIQVNHVVTVIIIIAIAISLTGQTLLSQPLFQGERESGNCGQSTVTTASMCMAQFH